MNYRTHACGGIAIGVVSVSLLGVDNIGVFQSGLVVIGSLFGSLLPDIDKKGTYMYNRLKFIGYFASKFGHRNIFHAPLIYTIIASIVGMFFGFVPLLFGVYFGIMSHLILDTLNYKGIPWLYPFTGKKFHICRIRAGSSMDRVVGVVCIILAIVVLVKY